MTRNRIDLAIEVAARAHNGQVRKNTDIPYISHPFSVGMILSRAGCPEDLIIAGILHDTIEDTGTTPEYIEEMFGGKVASIVKCCTEPDKDIPWEQRKRHTVEYMQAAPLEVRLVSCADKLHNIRTIAAEYSSLGDRVWERFKRGRQEQEWYYRAFLNSINTGISEIPDLLRQLKEEVELLFEN